MSFNTCTKGEALYLADQKFGIDSRREERITVSHNHNIKISVADELIKLSQLKASGDITSDEFEQIKKRLINNS